MIAADLQTYLMDAASTPWEWEMRDCCSLIADWCVMRGHDDPMMRWRGSYTNEEGARQHIAEAGGLVALVTLGMIDAGIPECDDPKIGDVGVVPVLGEYGPEDICAIYGGKRWHLRSPNGLFAARIVPHIAWRVG